MRGVGPIFAAARAPSAADGRGVAVAVGSGGTGVSVGDGSVSSGEGEVVLFGGGVYRRLTLFVAGGTRVSHWTGSSWETG